MSTYDYHKVMADYEHDRITVEMAVGHSLQHIGKLYEAQAAMNATCAAAQAKVEMLDLRVTTLQATVDRLTAFMEKVQRAQKKRTVPSQTQTDQA